MKFRAAIRLFLLAILASSTNQTSTKRGVSVTPRTYKCGDLEAFSSITWWYDWTGNMKGFEKAGCDQTYFPGYVPMIHKEKNLRWFNARANAEYILAFNEPNVADQANLTPNQTAALWDQVENKAGSRKIVGPSLAGCSNAQKCINWYTTFFAACPNCRVDYIGAHTYSCDAHGVVNALQKLGLHFNKKVWLTEFACPRESQDEQVTFLTKIMPLLEASTQVERYAWFTNRRYRNTTFLSDVVNLLDRNSPTLTPIGEYYDNYQ